MPTPIFSSSDCRAPLQCSRHPRLDRPRRLGRDGSDRLSASLCPPPGHSTGCTCAHTVRATAHIAPGCQPVPLALPTRRARSNDAHHAGNASRAHRAAPVAPVCAQVLPGVLSGTSRTACEEQHRCAVQGRRRPLPRHGRRHRPTGSASARFRGAPRPPRSPHSCSPHAWPPGRPPTACCACCRAARCRLVGMSACV